MVAGLGVGSQRENRYILPILILTDLSRCGVAVHHLEPTIHGNNVEVVCFSELRRLFAVFGQGHLKRVSQATQGLNPG